MPGQRNPKNDPYRIYVREGKSAFYACSPISANPYEFNTEKYKFWKRGWNRAKKTKFPDQEQEGIKAYRKGGSYKDNLYSNDDHKNAWNKGYKSAKYISDTIERAHDHGYKDGKKGVRKNPYSKSFMDSARIRWKEGWKQGWEEMNEKGESRVCPRCKKIGMRFVGKSGYKCKRAPTCKGRQDIVGKVGNKPKVNTYLRRVHGSYGG